MARRVVVTGVGVISALGNNAADFWQALAEGRSGIGPMTLVNPALLRFPNAAEVKGYDPALYFCNKETDFLDRFAQFAVVAAREAVRDAGIEWTPELRERGAVVTGSCVGGKSTEDEGERRRQPHLDREPHHRAGLHRLHRMLLVESRHRTGLLAGPQRRGGRRHHRRQRSAV